MKGSNPISTHPFTPTYIQMAKAAEEIQALRPKVPDDRGECPNSGSFFLSDHGELKLLHWDNDEARWMIGDYSDDGAQWTWIPRLDQLLGMLGAFNDFRYAVKDKNEVFWIDPAYDAFEHDWHELALAVVMREKYGKTWRDGKWEKV